MKQLIYSLLLGLLLSQVYAPVFAEGSIVGKWELNKKNVRFNWIFREDGTCSAYENDQVSIKPGDCNYRLNGERFTLILNIDGRIGQQSGTIKIDGDSMVMESDRSGNRWRRVR